MVFTLEATENFIMQKTDTVQNKNKYVIKNKIKRKQRKNVKTLLIKW